MRPRPRLNETVGLNYTTYYLSHDRGTWQLKWIEMKMIWNMK